MPDVTTDVSPQSPSARTVVAVAGWRLVAVGRDIVARLGMLGHIQHLQSFKANRRRARRVRLFVPEILANIVSVTGVIEPAGWTAEKLVHTDSDVMVVAAGSLRQPFQALIKVADTPAAAAGLRWQCEALTSLHGDARLGNLRDLFPHVLGAGEALGSAYLVESSVGGLSLEHLLRKNTTREHAVSEAANAIGRLHTATARETTIGEELLERWVGEPMRILREVTRDSPGADSTHAALERLAVELLEALEGKPIVVSWVHGDYGPGNILTAHNGRVSGIVDWEFAQPDDFPSLDIVTLLLTVRMSVRRQELGRVVRDLVANPSWSDSEAALVAAAPDADTCADIGIKHVVLLCWLRHTAWMITRASRYASSGLWLHTNIHHVLDDLPRPAADGAPVNESGGRR